MLKWILLLVVLVVIAQQVPKKNMQSPTLPFCDEEEYCLDSLCACCGECLEKNNFRCKIIEGTDCSSIDILTNTRSTPPPMTEKERKDGSEFFRYAMKFMNDSWDWDKNNAP